MVTTLFLSPRQDNQLLSPAPGRVLAPAAVESRIESDPDYVVGEDGVVKIAVGSRGD